MAFANLQFVGDDYENTGSEVISGISESLKMF